MRLMGPGIVLRLELDAVTRRSNPKPCLYADAIGRPCNATCRFGYKGLAFQNINAEQDATGVQSAPNNAITHGQMSTIGYFGGPAFGINSFYGTAFCRNYVRVNMTGFFRVRPSLVCKHGSQSADLD